MRQVDVDAHAAVVDALVEAPQRPLGAAVVPGRQSLVHLAHRHHVQLAVLAEPSPLQRVGVLRRTAQLAALRLGLAEQLDPGLALLVLGRVGGHAQDLAELAERPRQAVRHRADHRVEDALGGQHDAGRVAQQRAVERAVLDHDLDGGVGQVRQHLVVRLVEVGHVHRPVVDRPLVHQDLRAFGVAVRAVGDRRLAVGFGVVVEEGHHSAIRRSISSTRSVSAARSARSCAFPVFGVSASRRRSACSACTSRCSWSRSRSICWMYA